MNKTEAPSVPALSDVNAVLNYGADAQARVAEFSEIALENLKAKDLGEVSGKIAELIVKLKDTESEEKSGMMRLFKKPAATAEGLKSRYRKACEAVDRIALSLQGHRDLLMKDIEMLEMLYAMNREQYESLTAYLENGRKALKQFREETAAPLQKQAEESGDGADAQSARDALEQCDRFEKKLHDLELTRAVSLQMAPQIRMLQNNNTVMAEKIQSSVVNTIPLWKSQMVLTLGMENSRSAIEMQTKVTEITDALLRRNAQSLKETTVAVTRESERGCVSIHTLKETNAILIDTLDEMLKLREEGQRARQEAERELRELDKEIRLRLIGKLSLGSTKKSIGRVRLPDAFLYFNSTAIPRVSWGYFIFSCFDSTAPAVPEGRLMRLYLYASLRFNSTCCARRASSRVVILKFSPWKRTAFTFPPAARTIPASSV